MDVDRPMARRRRPVTEKKKPAGKPRKGYVPLETFNVPKKKGAATKAPPAPRKPRAKKPKAPELDVCAILNVPEVEILPPDLVDPYAREDALWIRQRDNQLATLKRIATSDTSKDADKIAAIRAVNAIEEMERKAEYDDTVLRFRQEVDRLMSMGATGEQAIDLLQEALDCLPSNQRQQVILLTRTSLLLK